MPDSYFRIAANKSEADQALYQHGRLIDRLGKVAANREERLPTHSDIRITHEFHLKKEFRPTILMSNDLIAHSPNGSTRQFRTQYSGDMQGQMFFKVDVSEGAFTTSAGVGGDQISFYAHQYPKNFVASLVKHFDYKVSGEAVIDANGDVFFLNKEMFIVPNLRPGLNRMWRETVLEFDYAPASPVKVIYDVPHLNAGVAEGDGSYAGRVDSLRLFMPHYSLQVPAISRPAFSIYIPLDIITCARGMSYAYPLSALHNLDRVIDVEFNELIKLINIVADDTSLGVASAVQSNLATGNNVSQGETWWAQHVDQAPEVGINLSTNVGGTVAATKPLAINVGVGLTSSKGFVMYNDTNVSAAFSTKPAISNVTLYVNYYLVHREFQKILSLNGYAYPIRQYVYDSRTVTSEGTWELGYTKIVEWVALIAAYTRNTAPTATSATLAINDVVGSAGTSVNEAYEIAPYYLPPDSKPIDNIDVLARGNVFYKEQSWDMLSNIWPYLLAGPESNTSKNNCFGVVPLCQRFSPTELTSTYNSGFGPNLEIRWHNTMFSSANPGRLTMVLCSINIFAAFRGVATIRYT